jgi:hypothetical protein
MVARIEDITAGWVLRLLGMYRTAERIAAARLTSLEKIPHLGGDRSRALIKPPADRWPRSAARWPQRWPATSVTS